LARNSAFSSSRFVWPTTVTARAPVCSSEVCVHSLSGGLLLMISSRGSLPPLPASVGNACAAIAVCAVTQLSLAIRNTKSLKALKESNLDGVAMPSTDVILSSEQIVPAPDRAATPSVPFLKQSTQKRDNSSPQVSSHSPLRERPQNCISVQRACPCGLRPNLPLPRSWKR